MSLLFLLPPGDGQSEVVVPLSGEGWGEGDKSDNLRDTDDGAALSTRAFSARR